LVRADGACGSSAGNCSQNYSELLRTVDEARGGARGLVNTPPAMCAVIFGEAVGVWSSKSFGFSFYSKTQGQKKQAEILFFIALEGLRRGAH